MKYIYINFLENIEYFTEKNIIKTKQKSDTVILNLKFLNYFSLKYLYVTEIIKNLLLKKIITNIIIDILENVIKTNNQ